MSYLYECHTERRHLRLIELAILRGIGGVAIRGLIGACIVAQLAIGKVRVEPQDIHFVDDARVAGGGALDAALLLVQWTTQQEERVAEMGPRLQESFDPEEMFLEAVQVAHLQEGQGFAELR